MRSILLLVLLTVSSVGTTAEFVFGASMSQNTLEARDVALGGETELPHYKLPEGLIPVDELPRNASDKVDRRALEAAVNRPGEDLADDATQRLPRPPRRPPPPLRS